MIRQPKPVDSYASYLKSLSFLASRDCLGYCIAIINTSLYTPTLFITNYASFLCNFIVRNTICNTTSGVVISLRIPF